MFCNVEKKRVEKRDATVGIYVMTFIKGIVDTCNEKTLILV